MPRPESMSSHQSASPPLGGPDCYSRLSFPAWISGAYRGLDLLRPSYGLHLLRLDSGYYCRYCWGFFVNFSLHPAEQK
jgi:hypothetical protein